MTPLGERMMLLVGIRQAGQLDWQGTSKLHTFIDHSILDLHCCHCCMPCLVLSKGLKLPLRLPLRSAAQRRTLACSHSARRLRRRSSR